MADNQDTRKLKRRDLLKTITAVPAAALIPLGSAVAAERHTSTHAPAAKAVAGYQRKVLNEHEWKTVNVLCDLIIPADERSGSASQAGVPAFIDDWLNFKGGELLAEIRGGLTWLDIECNQRFEHNFVDCAPAQQNETLDRIAYPAKASPRDSNYVAFFNHLRDLVVGGFFSSEVGVKDLPYLGNKVVTDWEGCPPNVLATIEKNLQTHNVGLSLKKQEES